MKKRLKLLLTVLCVFLAIVIAAALFLYFTSPKYKIEHGTIERVFIYHNELEREYYQFTDDEKQRLVDILENAEIGGMALSDYEGVDGGPWFSFCCEMDDGIVVQIYCAGGYLHLNSVPFEIDADSAAALSLMHIEIEDKILPISEEEYQEILSKR